jgi:N-methylhydantoinase A
MATRLGVDVGGTFSDLVIFDDETGELILGKAPSTPAAPDEGVEAVVAATAPRDLIARAVFFLHGTTVGLNALLERRGATVGLLATRGFRDTLELRRGDREALYDPLWKPKAPLVPRELRVGVTERTLADGTIQTELAAEEIEDAVATFRAAGVDSVAISFLHSYANPESELAAEAALRKYGFEGDISLSHKVSGEFREYERTSTTAIDAYIRPRVSHYLENLDSRLRGLGFDGQSLVTRSGGGAMSFGEAGDRSFETLMSGPAAGAVGAANVCQEKEIPLAVTADVGGTSFDTCLIMDGRPQLRHEGEIDGMPVQSPWIDVRSIGAGGGSIAYVDGGGLLRVGPRSAGATPGPACYGRGGTEPTVTDSAVVLGMIPSGDLAGGTVIDVERARTAVATIAEPLGMDLDEAARGVITIANAAMANAIRAVTVKQGYDARRAAILAFGGAGPLFGCLLAEELEADLVVVPPYAGNFSAWGLLGQPITRSLSRTVLAELDEDSMEGVSGVVEELIGTLRDGDGDGDGAGAAGASLDLRYAGQEYTLNVPIAVEDERVVGSLGAVAEAFSRDYERTYGHRLQQAIEVVSVRATTRQELPVRGLSHQGGEAAGDDEKATEAFSFAAARRLPFAVIDRDGLAPGETRDGPLIVKELTTTTYVDDGFRLEVDRLGAMNITRSNR